MTQPVNATRSKRSSPLLIAVAWIIVGIPAAWGVEQTFIKSMPLFTPPQSTAPVTATVAK